MKILIVEDEPSLRELIQRSLEKERYVVEAAGDFNSALRKIEDYDYDCILLDIMLPDGSGLDLLERLKALHKRENVIIISAKDSLEDKVLGLELGADDYITKPFSVRELLARVKAVLRRFSMDEIKSNIVDFGILKVDFEKREIHVKDKKLDLTLKEFELLEILIKNKGKILTRDMLLDKIWGYEYFGDTRVIDAHMKNIRKKIKKDYIKTIKGVGYVLEK